jgi:uroporphyrinogen-III synthase
MQPNRHILSTRPLSAPIVAEAAMNNIFIEEQSFIRTEPVANFTFPEMANDVVVFTSMNAVEAVAANITLQPKWLIYCVGNATSQKVAKLLPSCSIKFMGKDAESVAAAIISNSEREVTFFCGNIRRDELPAFLRSNDIKVSEIVVYKTILNPVKVEREFDGILFFSPSAVQSYFSVNGVSDTAVLFAIGSTTAGEVRKHCTNTVISAEEPGKNELVTLAIDYFTELSQTK